MAGLSTHVLDTSRGSPAAALCIELFRDGESEPLVSTSTNSDGRTEAPLLADGQLVAGDYEIHFHAGDYFRQNELATEDSILFLDVVVVRFGIGNIDQHYHVPLLLSPYGYSTYRGS